MYKRLMVSGILLLVLVMVLAGCSSTASPTASAPAATKAQVTSPASVKLIELKFASYAPPLSWTAKSEAQWADEVNKRLAGKVKVTHYPGEQLGSAMDLYDLLRKGVADIIVSTGSYVSREFPMINFGDVSYLLPSDWDKRQAIENQLFNKYLTGKFGYGEAKVLSNHCVGTTTLHTVKKPVRKLEDLKGLQIRTPPGLNSDAMKLLGGTPATIAIPEVYSALDRGMVDGVITGWTGVTQFKMEEVTKYHTRIDIGTTPNSYVMNLNVWNSLPPDIQKVFTDELNPLAQKISDGAYRQAEDDAIAVCQKTGGEIIPLSPEEKAKWVQATASLADKWASDMDAKGLPGTDLIKDARALVAAQK